MDTQKAFLTMMEEHTEIALATSVDDSPNVRVVNFYFDPDPATLFFATFADNQKVAEIEKNGRVAFTTIPKHGNEHVKAQGVAQKSAKSIYDVREGFTKRIPEYKDTIEQAGEYLTLFEIKFETATVTLDFEHINTFTVQPGQSS